MSSTASQIDDPIVSRQSCSAWKFRLNLTLPHGTEAQEVGTQSCLRAGCQAPVQIPIYTDILNTFSNPTLCFPYDQTSSTCTFQSDMYGGCHPEANKCKVHTVGDTTRGTNDKMFTKIQDRLYITVSDPWDQHWEKGVRGKLYESGQGFPRGTINIKREWTTVNPTLTEVLNTQAWVSSNILKTE